MGLNQALAERLAGMQIEDDLMRRIHIKMSGCPNGCGQHHIADIGFYGASIKVGERQMPAYIAHLGGHYEDGEVRIGARLKSRLPAKRIPDAIERWLRHYEANRADGEDWGAFVERTGTTTFEELVKDLAMPAEFSLESMNEFIDWSRSEPFQVIRGEGECAI
jgi:sulfite reductase beta subunit-like hemoprotein